MKTYRGGLILELDNIQLKQIVEIVEEKKAHDVVLLNLKGISNVTDYFLIATGNSTTQVKAIADNIDEKLPKAGIPILRIEGLPDAKWVLVDAGDLVVHIMTPEQREFYNLERLWGDGKVVTL